LKGLKCTCDAQDVAERFVCTYCLIKDIEQENQQLREALEEIRELEKKTLPINGRYIEIIYAALERKDG
jgi:hypothetical protein